MALHPDFPHSPYAILLPELRWFPAAEELRSTAYEKLLPPLVAKVREETTGSTRIVLLRCDVQLVAGTASTCV
jgi:hypothetical protein